MEKKWSGQVKSRSYDVISGTTFDKISEKSWENVTWRGAIDLNGDSWCDWYKYMARCDWHWITWFSRSTMVIWGHWPWLTSHWPIPNRHMLSGASWGAESEFVVHCSKNVPKPLFPHPLGQSSSFDQFEFWPLQRSQPARVMSFYLGALRMLNVATGYSNNTILLRIEQRTRWWKFQIATTHTYAAMSV